VKFTLKLARSNKKIIGIDTKIEEALDVKNGGRDSKIEFYPLISQ